MTTLHYATRQVWGGSQVTVKQTDSRHLAVVIVMLSCHRRTGRTVIA